MRMQAVIFIWTEVEVVDSDGVASRRKAMVPLPRYDNVCGRQFHDDEQYPLVVLEARSRASHNAYFAEIGRAFKNLPEKIAARWPSVEHFRKWCLVEQGWFDEVETEWDSRRDAMRHASYIRVHVDEYARISVHSTGGGKFLVIARHAKSQSAAAMRKDVFEESKKDVLDLVSSFIGVTTSELKKQREPA